MGPAVDAEVIEYRSASAAVHPSPWRWLVVGPVYPSRPVVRPASSSSPICRIRRNTTLADTEAVGGFEIYHLNCQSSIRETDEETRIIQVPASRPSGNIAVPESKPRRAADCRSRHISAAFVLSKHSRQQAGVGVRVGSAFGGCGPAERDSTSGCGRRRRWPVMPPIARSEQASKGRRQAGLPACKG